MSEQTFSERRELLISVLRELGNKEYSVNLLHHVIRYNAYNKENITNKLDSHRTVRYFLSSVAVGEDGKSPSYWNFEKFPDKGPVYADSDYRIRTRWSKFLQKMVKWGFLPDDYPCEKVAEYIGNNWPSKDDFTFELEDDAVEVYDRASFGSCMYGKDYVNWYNDNKDVVRVVGIYRKGDYVGRALLWTVNDEDGSEVKYLDRVYPSDGGAHTRAIRDWANENGYLCKDGDDREDEDREFIVTMKPSSNGYYPYMDTLKYGFLNEDDDTITLSTQRRYGRLSYDECLTSTDGQGFAERCTCARCGNRVSEDETSTVMVSGSNDFETWCDNCASYHTTYIPYVSRASNQSVAAGYSVPDNEAIELHNGRVVTRWDDVAECEYSGDYYWLDEMSTTSLSDKLIADEYLVTLSNGDTCCVDELDDFLIIELGDEHRYIQDCMDDVGLDSDDVDLANKLYNMVKAGKTFEQAVFKHRFVDAFNSALQLTEFSESVSKTNEERVA